MASQLASVMMKNIH